MPKVPKISEAEWVVMKVIWATNPITAREVISALEGSTDWAPETIKTLITRLAQKGALKRLKQGRTHVFSPKISEEACLERESDSFLSRFFGGSMSPMLAYFVEKGKLSIQEVEELKALLEEDE